MKPPKAWSRKCPLEVLETARSSVEQQDLRIDSLLGANTKFYEAYSHLDLRAMADIWEPSQRATVCAFRLAVDNRLCQRARELVV